MEKKLYNSLKKAIQKINSTITLQEVAVDYIYSNISEKELIQLVNRGLPTFNTKLLKQKSVFEATLKVLAIMETCNTWAEFEQKKGSKKPNKTELDNFNEVLKTFTKINKTE
jgi:hypothetical protein